MERTEEQFIEGINRKQRWAYHDLYKRYYKSLVGYATKYLHDWDMSEDVVQQSLISLWMRESTFASCDKLRNFLYLNLRNTCLDVLKHRVVEEKYIKYYKERISAVEQEEEVITEEVFRMLSHIIDTLPARCREIFLLYMEGKKNDEIAEVLGIALNTVKNQKKKALQVLRLQLGELFLVLVAWRII